MHAKTALIIIVAIVATVGLPLTASTRHVFASDTGGIKGQGASFPTPGPGCRDCQAFERLQGTITHSLGDEGVLGAIAKFKAHASSDLSSTEQEALGAIAKFKSHASSGLGGTPFSPNPCSPEPPCQISPSIICPPC